MQWHTHHLFKTTADPVMAKSPGVTPNTATQPREMPQHYRATSRPRWTLTNANTTPSTENTCSPSLTKLNYIELHNNYSICVY